MTDQGLSIFDDDAENGRPDGDRAARGAGAADGESTQVIPTVSSGDAGRSQGSSASRPVLPPRPRRAPASQARSQAGPRSGNAGGATTAAVSTFPVVRRNGYDKAAVDSRMRQLASEKAGLSASLSDSERRVIDLESEVTETRKQVHEAKSPSYAGLGGRASTMLRLAEEEADEIRESAQRDAADIRAHAAHDTKALRADAQREIDEMKTAQLRELEESRTRSNADATQRRAQGEGEATDLVAAAQREADQVRLAAQQETNEMRSGATREVEQARAGADREVQEARRTLAVEKERLAREATDHHNTATAETKRLVEEAEQRATAAEQRAAEAAKQAGEHRTSAQSESESVLSRARGEAEQIVSAARHQAESISASSDDAAQREIAATRAELARLTKRRDSITAQLASLRDVVAGFADDGDGDETAETAAVDGDEDNAS